MSDIILSDVRVELPKAPLLASQITSAPVPKAPGANLLIVEFCPNFSLTTKVHSLMKAPTTAPPPGQTWTTPLVHVERHISMAVGVAGRRRYVSPEDVFTQDILVGYNENPNPLDFSGVYDARIASWTVEPNQIDAHYPDNTTGKIQGYLHIFSLGDGSGAVEAVRAGPVRVSLSLLLHTNSKTAGTLTLYDDSFDGEYRITVWGT